MNFNLKSLPSVPSAKDFIEEVLSKVIRKTSIDANLQNKVIKVKKFYIKKIKFIQSTIGGSLQNILEKFPRIDDIHPFYADLMNILYDGDQYQLSLVYLNKANHVIENIAKYYVKMIKDVDSIDNEKALKKEGLGRICTILKKIADSLAYLEEVRKHFLSLPNIDPNSRSIIIIGYPNVGKSSFMNLLTRANVEVQPYPFTTKSLFTGSTDYDNLPWQVIDSPGLFDRPLEQRNTIEMQVIPALTYLNSCILFLIDISETCGFTIEQQILLFKSIEPFLINKSIGIVITKIDLHRWDQVPFPLQSKIMQLADTHKAFIKFVSNYNQEGVIECRNAACEHLKAFSDIQSIIPELLIQSLQIDEKSLLPKLQKENVAGVEDEKCKYDAISEYFEGKNELDYIDSDIMKQLNELEHED